MGNWFFSRFGFLHWSLIIKIIFYGQCLFATNPGDQSIEASISAFRSALEKGFYQQTIEQIDSLLLASALNGEKFSISQQGDLNSILGNAYRKLGFYEKAITHHKKALTYRKENESNTTIPQAQSFLNLANCYLSSGENDQAYLYLQQAEAIQQSHPIDTAQLYIPLLNSFGIYYQNQSQYEKAKSAFTKSLLTAKYYYGPEHPKTLGKYINLANLKAKQFQLNESIALLENALHSLKADGEEHVGLRITILNNLGNTWTQKGMYRKAYTLFQQAESLIGSGNVSKEQKINHYTNTGYCMLDWGEYDRALEYFRQARFLSEKRPELAVDVILAIGLTYRYSGDLDNAIQEFSEAVLWAENHQLPRAVFGSIYYHLGTCYLDRGTWGGAIYYFQKAIDHFPPTPKYQLQVIACQNKLATCWLKQGGSNTRKALKTINTALQNTPDEANELQFAIYYQLGNYYQDEKLYSKALAAYQSASCAINPNQEDWTNTPFPYESIQVHLALSGVRQKMADHVRDALQKQKQLDIALRTCQEGITLLEQWRQQFTSEQTIIQANNIFYGLYNQAIFSSAALAKDIPAYKEVAFQLAEGYKNTFLSNLTADFEPNASLSSQDSLKKLLTQYKKQRFFYNQNPRLAFDDPQYYSLDSMILVIKSQIQSVDSRPTSQPQASSPSSGEIRASLKADETLVNYHWGNQKLHLFILRQDTFAIANLPIAPTLQQEIQTFNIVCQTPPDWLPKQTQHQYIEAFAQLGLSLYEQLIQPVEHLLTPTLSIVPDAMTCLIPFEAMISKPPNRAHRFDANEYLIKDYTIQYYQSAALRVLNNRGKNWNRKSLLAIAPSFENQTIGLDPLRYNIYEAEQINEIWNGKILTGAKAQKASFLTMAHQYKMILLSTHGIMDDQQPAYSFLAFTEIVDSTVDNDLLFADEIYNLRLNAELVVLSACQTASGQLSRGEGLLSIARSFFHAGAKSIVASMWNAGDEQAKLLMTRFFQNLKNQLNKADALRLAKIDYLNEIEAPFDAHPFYWAGFIGIGDKKVITLPKDLTHLHIWFVVLLLLGIGSFLTKHPKG